MNKKNKKQAGKYLKLRAEIYNPLKHQQMIQDYMASTAVVNNSSAKALRIADYDGEDGALFLVINDQDRIVAVSSVLSEPCLFGRAAKIYGRFHIESKIPHTVIDQFLEPMTFLWCEERHIDNLFLTVNEGNYRILDWVCWRLGKRRKSLQFNPFAPNLGQEKRTGFRPLNNLIFERNCWQYVLFYSKESRWFLQREVKPLDSQAREIFNREFF